MAYRLTLRAVVLLLGMLLCVRSEMDGQQTGEAKLGTTITSLPYTISAPGVYVLTQDFLNLNLASGNAIQINASDVVLDLNGHTLSNTAAGAGTLAYGVYATDQSNVTVRNGTVQGFMTGVALTVSDFSTPPTTSYGHLVEKMNVNGCTYEGISVAASDSTVRSCQVENIGGSSVLDQLASAYGIDFLGTGLRCLDCDVSQITASGTDGVSYAIYLDNVTDAFVLNNRMSAAQYGLYFGAASGQYRHNLATGMFVQNYVGGTDAGQNIVDANGDGIDDDWEMKYFGTLNVNLNALAPNGEGMTILQAYQQGINPVDFYTSQTPSLSIVSGTSQSAAPGSFVAYPLVVQVVDSNGNPIIGAPITFSVASGGGQLQTSRQASPKPTLSVMTDVNGQAKAFFQVSATAGVTSSISAIPTGTSPTTPQTFQETANSSSPVNPTPTDPNNSPTPQDVPAQSYACIDLSSSVQGNDDVTMIALDDQGNAAFAWLDGPGNGSDGEPKPGEVCLSETWSNGTLGGVASIPLNAATPPPDGNPNKTARLLRSPTSVLADGTVGGVSGVQTTYNPPNGWGWEKYTTFLATGNHVSDNALPALGANINTNNYEAIVNQYVLVQNGSYGVIDWGWYEQSTGVQEGEPWFIQYDGHYAIFASSSPDDAGNDNVTIVPNDFLPAAMNDQGNAVGSCPDGAYYWDGRNLVSMESTDLPAGINSQQQVVVAGAYGTGSPRTEGYLWENGIPTILVNKLPAEIAGKISNIQPKAISNQTNSDSTSAGYDQTIYILATANVTQPDGTVVNAPIVCTRDNDGEWSFVQVGVPDGTTISQYASINSSGVIAVTGSIPSSSDSSSSAQTNKVQRGSSGAAYITSRSGDPSSPPSSTTLKAGLLSPVDISLVFAYGVDPNARDTADFELRGMRGLQVGDPVVTDDQGNLDPNGDVKTYHYSVSVGGGKKFWTVQTSANRKSFVQALENTAYVYCGGHANSGAGVALKNDSKSDDLTADSIKTVDDFMHLRNSKAAIPWREFWQGTNEYPKFDQNAISNNQISVNPTNYAIDQSGFSRPIQDATGKQNPARFPNTASSQYNTTYVDVNNPFTLHPLGGVDSYHLVQPSINEDGSAGGLMPFLIANLEADPKPKYAYKILVLDVCNGARDYSEVFNHGHFISPDNFVWYNSDGPTDFVTALMDGGGIGEILGKFDVEERREGVFTTKNFSH